MHPPQQGTQWITGRATEVKTPYTHWTTQLNTNCTHQPTLQGHSCAPITDCRKKRKVESPKAPPQRHINNFAWTQGCTCKQKVQEGTLHYNIWTQMCTTPNHEGKTHSTTLPHITRQLHLPTTPSHYTTSHWITPKHKNTKMHPSI